MNILSLLKDSQLKKIKIIDVFKNNILFHENDKCECICIVLKGEIKIVSYSFSGREIIYSTLKENEIFGNNLIFSSSPFYKGSVIAKVNSKIAIIDKITLVDLLMNNKEFLLSYLSIIGNLTKNLNDKNKLLSFDKAKDRLLYYLYKNNNHINYESITDLASKLNLKRETLSRTITALVKENIIIHLDKEIKLI